MKSIMTLSAIYAFAQYFLTSLALLYVFMQAYIRFTPYHELELIKQNNNAAAISLSGAIVGFTLPLLSAIYYTVSIPEMLIWALHNCTVQFVLFALMRSQAKSIEAGMTAPAILLASLSVCAGLLNAVCISH